MNSFHGNPLELFIRARCCYFETSTTWVAQLPTEVEIKSRREEFDCLLSREIPHLRRYAHALVNDPVLADDLVQDCLERALRKWWLWKPTGRMRSWLFRMLYRIYLNQLPKLRRDTAQVPLAESVDPISETSRQSLTVELRETATAIDGLPDDQRSAVLLVALEGMNYDEAAWVLGIPVGTLRSRLSRGREALRSAARDAEPAPNRLRRVK